MPIAKAYSFLSRLGRPYFMLLAAGAFGTHSLKAQDAHAGHHMNHVSTPASEESSGSDVMSLSAARDGSGTGWMPDESPMYGIHAMLDDWRLMFHANIFLEAIHESSARADDQIGSINWFMVMAQRKVGEGDLSLRLMMSAENWTVGKCGYPDLLQTGEVCNGKALHDQQHPHDLFMEIAADYKLALAPGLGLQIYAGAVGEPALGPVAFPHRLSAFPGPQGPVSHHWLDSTHISFGVATVGLFTQEWKAEMSLFNGREPDDNRTDLDLDTLDSYSGRISYLPNRNWALQISAGQLNEAEKAEDGSPIDVKRYTASAMYHKKLEAGGIWATTLAYGENIEHSESSTAQLLESSLSVADKHIFSGRVEWVEKSGHDLVLHSHDLEEKSYKLTKAGLGYLYQFDPLSDWAPGVGLTATESFLPEALKEDYKERRPTEFTVYASLRPKAMDM